MHKLYELKEKLMKELEEYADNGKFSKDDVEVIKYAASAIDHICNIMESADEEYSEAGGRSYYVDGMGNVSYARGRGGSSYARGRRNARRDSMGRYSREGGYSYAEDDMHEILADMRGIMSKLPAEKQREVREFIDNMERM